MSGLVTYLPPPGKSLADVLDTAKTAARITGGKVVTQFSGVFLDIEKNSSLKSVAEAYQSGLLTRTPGGAPPPSIPDGFHFHDMPFGQHLEKSAADAIKVARAAGEDVGFTHSGVPLRAGPGSSVGGIVDQYRGITSEAAVMVPTGDSVSLLRTFGRVAGRAALPVTIAAGVGVTAYDVSQGDYRGAAGAAASTGGALAGGIAGAEAGAAAGGAVGAFFGGVGAIPGAAVGGIVGGVAGGIGGALAGADIGTFAYDHARDVEHMAENAVGTARDAIDHLADGSLGKSIRGKAEAAYDVVADGAVKYIGKPLNSVFNFFSGGGEPEQKAAAAPVAPSISANAGAPAGPG